MFAHVIEISKNKARSGMIRCDPLVSILKIDGTRVLVSTKKHQSVGTSYICKRGTWNFRERVVQCRRRFFVFAHNYMVQGNLGNLVHNEMPILVSSHIVNPIRQNPIAPGYAAFVDGE